MVRVTLVNVERERPVRVPDDMEWKGTVTGDGPDYFLPGANYEATVEALHDAGFKIVDSIKDALEDDGQ